MVGNQQGIVYTMMAETISETAIEENKEKAQQLSALTELAEYLTLKRPASARFWRLKAIEILNAPGRSQTGPTPVVNTNNMWTSSAGMSNGKH